MDNATSNPVAHRVFFDHPEPDPMPDVEYKGNPIAALEEANRRLANERGYWRTRADDLENRMINREYDS